MAERQYYSRLARLEYRRNRRSALVFGVLTIALILFLVFYGVPLIARLSIFLSGVGNSSAPIDNFDNTPPAPPKFALIPEATSKDRIIVEGFSEEGATITIFADDEKFELVADSEGRFSKEISLKKGDNVIFAKAKDKNGNESLESKRYTIISDSEKPELTITKPKNGENFYGKQKQINVEGTTEGGATLTINDRVVIVSSDGKFVFPTNLSDGENSFNLKSTDKAGNQTEITIKVSYSP